MQDRPQQNNAQVTRGRNDQWRNDSNPTGGYSVLTDDRGYRLHTQGYVFAPGDAEALCRISPERLLEFGERHIYRGGVTANGYNAHVTGDIADLCPPPPATSRPPRLRD